MNGFVTCSSGNVKVTENPPVFMIVFMIHKEKMSKPFITKSNETFADVLNEHSCTVKASYYITLTSQEQWSWTSLLNTSTV